MSAIPRNIHPHLAWLACLHAIHYKVRREGYMAIEYDVNKPDDEQSLFHEFPHVMRQPYLGFATDILRLMLTGLHDPDELSVYAEQAIKSLTTGWIFQRADETLLRTIWLTLWSFAKGNSPRITCEFGRQAIPVRMKPTADELEDWLGELEYERRQRIDDKRGEGGLEAVVDRFMASIETPDSINGDEEK